MSSEPSADAPEPLVKWHEASVIIAGGSHEDLWVHPNLVTIPGDPIVVEVALRSTDREGKDAHAETHYFRTDDDFASLSGAEKAEAEAWKRIGLTGEDFEPTTVDGTDLREAVWHWARDCVHVDAETMVCPFLTLDGGRHSVRTVAAKPNGDISSPLYVSNALTNEVGRGLLEPHIAAHDGRLFMTLRAEDSRGYVAVSEDAGRSWGEPRAWTWDDGDIIPMHTTMTKLLAHSDGLLLVYTRIRHDNQSVFRSRAPLHCAEVDPSTLSLKRSTERILVPNRGFPVGNFWVWPIDQQKSYVTVAEWPRDGRAQNGDTWLVKIHWNRPNELLTPDGHERVAVG